MEGYRLHGKPYRCTPGPQLLPCLHQNEAQQVVTQPGLGVQSSGVSLEQANAPDVVVGGGFH